MDDLELFNEMLPWAKARAKALVSDAYLEDAEQEASLGLWQAIQYYQPEMDVTLKTYASTVIRNQVLDFMRKEKRHSNVRYRPDMTDVIDTEQEQADEFYEQYQKNIAIRNACGKLSDREEDILDSRLLSPTPDSLQEIADRWGVTHYSIMRDENKIKDLIRRNYNG